RTAPRPSPLLRLLRRRLLPRLTGRLPSRLLRRRLHGSSLRLRRLLGTGRTAPRPSPLLRLLRRRLLPRLTGALRVRGTLRAFRAPGSGRPAGARDPAPGPRRAGGRGLVTGRAGGCGLAGWRCAGAVLDAFRAVRSRGLVGLVHAGGSPVTLPGAAP